MSHKSSPSKEFLKFYHLHNSQDTEKIDIAYSCWREMQVERNSENALRECRKENKSLKQELGRSLE